MFPDAACIPCASACARHSVFELLQLAAQLLVLLPLLLIVRSPALGFTDY